MKILMVCLGNICRSPLAHGLLEQKAKNRGIDWIIDSAGTSGWHNGSPPHTGSIDIAAKYGYHIEKQQSRKITRADLDDFDLILAMDSSNYQDILQLSESKSHQDKIKLILNYVFPQTNRAVPDPYYTGNFQEVFDLLDQATDAILLKYIPQV
jgi:protein-tyrosine phosphatase